MRPNDPTAMNSVKGGSTKSNKIENSPATVSKEETGEKEGTLEKCVKSVAIQQSKSGEKQVCRSREANLQRNSVQKDVNDDISLKKENNAS